MNCLVTYKSKTGFTEKYAVFISGKLGCDLIPFESLTAEKMGQYNTVVYGGGCYAGSVNGLNKAKADFEKSGAERLILFAVGATPDTEEKLIAEAWCNMLTPDERNKYPHFYMQGGIAYEKMGVIDQTAMKMFARFVKKNADAGKGGFSREMADMISHSYDIYDEKYAQPLIEEVLKDR